MSSFFDRFNQRGYLFLMLNEHGLLNLFSDEFVIKRLYKIRIGKKLNIDKPISFNEKLQWLKLYDRKPEYIPMVDKYAVRNIIQQKIGDEYLIPLLGVWNHAEDINFEQLPNQFVLKCTHDSGSVIFCKDKSDFDFESAKKSLDRHLKKSGYIHGREWPYKEVPRRIIAEKYMVDESGTELKDYKVLCFNGVPKLIELHSGRYGEHTQDFYDTNWNRTSITQCGTPLSSTGYPVPDSLNEMISLSSILSKGIPHLRVDWYSIYGKLYFSELTFFDGSGFDPFDNSADDELLGSWIELP